MILIPAIDILDGRPVQLQGGDPTERLWEGEDAVREAQRWWDLGAERLHVIDLERVLRNRDSAPLIQEILKSAQGPVQVGGGLRTAGALREILDVRDDATAVVATRAWRDPDWLDHISTEFPGRIIAALELKGGTITVRGWTKRLTLTLDEGLHRLAGLDLAGVLFTDVDREGRKGGPNLESTARAVEILEVPLIVSGGVSTVEHVASLAEAGAWATIVGTALYTGELDFKEAKEAAK